MKPSCVFLIAASFVLVPLLRAQAVPAAGRAWDSKPMTWNVAGSASYLGSDSSGSQRNYFGWNASVSEYPYRSFSWLGGTIEMSGHYSNESRTDVSNGISYRISVNRTVYTFAGGPSVTFGSGRAKPFAHALFGEINTRTDGRLNGSKGSTLRTLDPALNGSHSHPGMLLGGGLDFGVTSAIAIRAQADWVQEWAPGQAVNFIRAGTGVVYRF